MSCYERIHHLLDRGSRQPEPRTAMVALHDVQHVEIVLGVTRLGDGGFQAAEFRAHESHSFWNVVVASVSFDAWKVADAFMQAARINRISHAMDAWHLVQPV
jgi:hypothetical protein